MMFTPATQRKDKAWTTGPSHPLVGLSPGLLSKSGPTRGNSASKHNKSKTKWSKHRGESKD